MLLFKIIGFLATIAATYSFALLKCNQLKMRSKKLHNAKKSIITLKEKIRVNMGEIDSLLLSCFEEYPLNYHFLEQSEIELLEEFFGNIGMSDTKSEYERCELYINLLTPKVEEADQNLATLSKLYRSIGLLSGIFICIILL